jgi:hypothetical protein
MIEKLNALIRSRITTFEMVGVGMRIFSFSLVGWMGAKSPFILVWVVNYDRCHTAHMVRHTQKG